MKNVSTVQIAAKTYVVDLWWQVRVGNAASRKSMLLTARETALELKENFNCVALRPQQYGLGRTESQTGGAVGHPSLAAALRPQVQIAQGFLGIFCLHEGWWVCAISRGAIAATGDRLFEDETSARSHVRQLKDLFGSSVEIVCATPEESEQLLTPLLASDARVEKLFPDPDQRKAWMRVGMGCLVFVLLGFALKQVWDSRVQESALQSTRQLLQSKEARRQEILIDPGRHFDQSWRKSPNVQAQGGICLSALLAVPLASNGWALNSASCKPGSLNLQWGHRPGASYTQLPEGARLDDPKKATVQRTLSRAEPRQLENLLSRPAITARLYELTRSANCRLRLSWASREKKVINEVEVQAPWVRGNWELEAVPASVLLSGELLALLSVPGLSLTELTLDKKNWKIKGLVYADWTNL